MGNLIKRIWGFAAALALICVAAGAMADMTISTIADWEAFAAQAQGGETFAGETITLANDLNFGGAYIFAAKDGTTTADLRIPNFAGTFNGQGHKLYNMKYSAENTSGVRATIFSGTLTGTLKNLRVEDVTAYFDLSGTQDARFAPVANTVSGYLENVHTKNISAESVGNSTAIWFTGMFVYAKKGALIAKDCSVTNFDVDAVHTYIIGGFTGVITPNNKFENCDIINAKFTVNRIGDVFGGFAGQTQSGGSNATFTNCDVKNLQVDAKDIAEGVNVGGFISSIGGAAKFNDCAVTGSISVEKGTEKSAVGGFVGDLGWNQIYGPNRDHKFVGCSADVNVTTVNANAGGFVGNSTVAGHPYRYMPTYFIGCTASGDVTSANASAGGFVGVGDRGVYEGCTASGDVKGKIAGGFWGSMYPKSAEPTGPDHPDKKENQKTKIVDSGASGKVNGSEYAAGLVGYIDNVYGDNDDGYATPVVLLNVDPSDNVSGPHKDAVYNPIDDKPKIELSLAVPPKNVISSLPQTGDASNMALFAALLSISAVGLAILKRKENAA